MLALLALLAVHFLALQIVIAVGVLILGQRRKAKRVQQIARSRSLREREAGVCREAEISIRIPKGKKSSTREARRRKAYASSCR